MKKAQILWLMPLFALALSACSLKPAAQVNSPVEDNNQSVENTAVNNVEATQTPEPSSPELSLTLNEVAKHNSPSDCWLAIDGQVYNVSEFVVSGKHPGGDKILNGCGKDATLIFQMVGKHEENNAAQFLPQFLLGPLVQ